MSRNSNFRHDPAIAHKPLSVITQVSHKLRYLKLGYASAIRFNAVSLKPVLLLKFK